MRKIKVGEMVWSNHFKSWIKVVEIIDDKNWWFLHKGWKLKAKTSLSYFEKKEL